METGNRGLDHLTIASCVRGSHFVIQNIQALTASAYVEHRKHCHPRDRESPVRADPCKLHRFGLGFAAIEAIAREKVIQLKLAQRGVMVQQCRARTPWRSRGVMLHSALAVTFLLLAFSSPVQAARRLQGYPFGPFPESAFNRSSMAGAARGRKPGGQPDPVPGLANPDVPALANSSASMAGAWQGLLYTYKPVFILDVLCAT